jgi:hypothetical protein
MAVKQEKLRREILDAKEKSGQAWNEIRSGVENAWNELTEAADHARAEIEKTHPSAKA